MVCVLNCGGRVIVFVEERGMCVARVCAIVCVSEGVACVSVGGVCGCGVSVIGVCVIYERVS